MFVSDGGIQTDLIFNYHQNLPHFADIDLFNQDYFRSYCSLLKQKNLRFLMISPTWRGHADFIEKLKYTPEQMKQYNTKSIRMLHQLREEYELKDAIVAGYIGPRGDAYSVNHKMSVEQAKQYHLFQIKIFKQQKVDTIMSGTMNYLEEPLGIVKACKQEGIKVIICFTVEVDGRLPCGLTLKETINSIDAETEGYVDYYMINCAHPTHFEAVLSQNPRLKGIRVNSSRKSHKQLDQATQLDSGDIEQLGKLVKQLQMKHELITIGGCCGTDIRHIKAMIS